VQDIAEVVKEEAKKSETEPGKLKRWGDRLAKITEDVGLKVVSGTIAGILLKMYTGG
jgi:choline kinase